MSKLINVASFKFRTDTQSPWQELILTGKVDPLNGVPAGGTAGQLLAKASATDYDTVWVNDGLTILSYGNSTWADFIAVYNAQKVVYCRASSNSNPASGSQTRLAFMAYVNNAANPTEVEFQYYRSVSSHSDSQQGDQVFVYKLNKNTGWSVTTRNAFTKIVAGTGLSSSYSNGALTLANVVKRDLLWTNTSPSSYEGGTIYCDMQGYDEIEIECLPFANVDPSCYYTRCRIGEANTPATTALTFAYINTDLSGLNAIGMVTRSADVYSGGIVFGNGQMIYDGVYYKDWTNRAVPYRVWGIKY